MAGTEKFQTAKQFVYMVIQNCYQSGLAPSGKESTGKNISYEDVASHLAKSMYSDPYFKADAVLAKMQEAILTLPEKQRIVFNMRYYEELSYEEMSEILDTSVGGPKASYHHAVKKIGEYLLNKN